MYYVYPDFVSKKAFKDAWKEGKPLDIVPTEGYEASTTKLTRTIAVGGPHYPAPHRWFASVKLQDGKVVSIS